MMTKNNNSNNNEKCKEHNCEPDIFCINCKMYFCYECNKYNHFSHNFYDIKENLMNKDNKTLNEITHKINLHYYDLKSSFIGKLFNTINQLEFA